MSRITEEDDLVGGFASRKTRATRWLATSSLVAGLLAASVIAIFPAAASPPPSANLLQNPDAEAGQSGHGQLVAVPGWSLTGSFTVDDYGDVDRLSKTVGQTVAGGNNYFFGGPGKDRSTATQTVDVSHYADEIDKGALDSWLGGYLGGYASQSDFMDFEADFLNGSGAMVGTVMIHGPGPSGPPERNGKTTMVAHVFMFAVPAGTRQIRVVLTATRLAGSNNDGYADNLVLFLRERTPAAIADALRAMLPKLAAEALSSLPVADAARALALMGPKAAGAILAQARPSDAARIVALLKPKVAVQILYSTPCCSAQIVALLKPKVALKILYGQPCCGAEIVALLQPKVAARILGAVPAQGATILARLQFAVGVRILRLEPRKAVRATLKALPAALATRYRTALHLKP